MNAVSSIEIANDPIRALMPGIGREEYRLRKRLREAHDLALKMVGDAPDGAERLLWIALRDHTGVWLYQGAPIDIISDAAAISVSIWRAAHECWKLESKIEGLTADGRG